MPGLLAFLEDKHADRLAWQHHWSEGVAQLVDVQHPHPLELRNLVQIQIVGDHLGADFLGHDHDLGIHVLHVRKVVVHDAYVDIHHLPDLVEDVQPSPAARAFERIR